MKQKRVELNEWKENRIPVWKEGLFFTVSIFLYFLFISFEFFARAAIYIIIIAFAFTTGLAWIISPPYFLISNLTPEDLLFVRGVCTLMGIPFIGVGLYVSWKALVDSWFTQLAGLPNILNVFMSTDYDISFRNAFSEKPRWEIVLNPNSDYDGLDVSRLQEEIAREMDPVDLASREAVMVTEFRYD